MATHKILTVLAVLFSAQLSNSHMIMKSPVPYGAGTLNNSPLSGDFPCKQRAGVYEVTQMNNMAVGEQQSLSFIGSATHAGGSCQISISLDKQPNAQSSFKVIHSIVGGCPTTGTDPATFNFSVPKEVPNGEWTLAWTWFNKIGNREMYMNCAPITVTGGASDNTAFNKLPDMFIANQPSTQCKTPESKDIIFPDPGDSVVTIASTALATLPEICGKAATPAPTSAGLSSIVVISSASATSSAPTFSLPSNPGGIFVPSVTSSSHVATKTTNFATPAPATSSPAAKHSSTAADAPNGKPPTPSGAGKANCTQDGVLLCNGLSQWGLCDHGRVIWQPVAPGTRCVNGQILKRSFRFERHGRVMRPHGHFY